MTPDYETLWAAPQSRWQEPLEIRHVLAAAAESLRAAGSATARLDADVLLAHVLGVSRSQLYARLRDPWPQAALEPFGALLRRRLEGEPVAYLIGHKDFFGLDLLVDRRVLIPRPETEELVGKALAILPDDASVPLADIGTGSGAIAITVATLRPRIEVYAVDVSPDALAVARHNCERHGVSERVHLLQGDLLTPLPGPVQGIIANLPYTVEAEVEPDVLAWEPRLALEGGGEIGAALIARLLQRAPDYLLPGGFIALEIGWNQAETLLPLAAAAFPDAEIAIQRDLSDRDRILWLRTSSGLRVAGKDESDS